MMSCASRPLGPGDLNQSEFQIMGKGIRYRHRSQCAEYQERQKKFHLKLTVHKRQVIGSGVLRIRAL